MPPRQNPPTHPPAHRIGGNGARAGVSRVGLDVGVEVLEDGVESPAGDPEKVACQGVVIKDDGTSLAPLFLLFEMDYAVWNGKRFCGSPIWLGGQWQGGVH